MYALKLSDSITHRKMTEYFDNLKVPYHKWRYNSQLNYYYPVPRSNGEMGVELVSGIDEKEILRLENLGYTFTDDWAVVKLASVDSFFFI